MRPRDLIASAKKLVGEGQVGSPKQSDLKRALSTAYYAMFHALCWNCADSFIGTANAATRAQSAWRQAYRAVEHGRAKNQCKNNAVMGRFPAEIQDFANQFVDAQERRHEADYDPFSKFTRHDVLIAIDAANTAIKKLKEPNIKHRKAFAVWTTMRNRSD